MSSSKLRPSCHVTTGPDLIVIELFNRETVRPEVINYITVQLTLEIILVQE